MSWAALPVEPACMGKAVGEAGRPLMLCGARLYIITDIYYKVFTQNGKNLTEGRSTIVCMITAFCIECLITRKER